MAGLSTLERSAGSFIATSVRSCKFPTLCVRFARRSSLFCFAVTLRGYVLCELYIAWSRTSKEEMNLSMEDEESRSCSRTRKPLLQIGNRAIFPKSKNFEKCPSRYTPFYTPGSKKLVEIVMKRHKYVTLYIHVRKNNYIHQLHV